MDWEKIVEEWQSWENMSCKPNTKRVKEGTVIDEDKSVRWNREEVERLNKEYDAAVAALNTNRNKARDILYEHIYAYIIDEVGHNCTKKKAMAIWEYAYERGHSYGLSEIYCHLNELIALADVLLSDK